MNKIIRVLFIVLLFTLPLFVGWLVSFNICGWLETSNDWIGFWGGYLGGLCTLVGVLLTINFSKKDSDEKQRLSVIPYISIERNAAIDIEGRRIPIGLVYAFSESRNDNHLLFFDEIKVVGKCESVGLGPVINCGIVDIKIGERSIDSDTTKVGVLTVSGESYFLLYFLSIGLYPEQLEREFIDYYKEFWSPTNKEFHPPELSIEFFFCFEDVLGHKYKQKVIYVGQLSEPSKGKPDSLNILFERISKPELL